MKTFIETQIGKEPKEQCNYVDGIIVNVKVTRNCECQGHTSFAILFEQNEYQ